MKKEFLREQKEWLKTEGRVKPEQDQEVERMPKKRNNSRIKVEDANETGTAAPRKRLKVEPD